MIKAVCFDWFNTLAHYQPSREELQSQAFSEFGVSISSQEIVRGLLIADRDCFKENAVSPIRQRSQAEQDEIYARYQKTIITEAGIDLPDESSILLKVRQRLQQLFIGIHFVLFDDVLSTVKALKEQKLILGLLTNLGRDMQPLCRELGLEPYVDFIVTSGEVGVNKPEPLIFQTTLQRAGVDASEAVHVGDQYDLDVVGARGVGMTPVLIDRHDLYPGVNDCRRIRSLSELADHL